MQVRGTAQTWAAVVSLTITSVAGATVSAAPCWVVPVTAAVSDPFRAPACPWCPGNRGIEFATVTGDPVTSIAAGTVTFSGSVAGRGYVVVELANGWRLTYGNVDDRRVGTGDTVVAGVRLGSAAGLFHLGLRDGDTYLDPEPFLGEWRYRVRLIPSDGGQPAPAPAPRLECPAAIGAGRAATT